MFGILEIGETNIMAREKNYNKGLVTIKITVTKQTAWHIAQLAKTANCSEGRIIDKMVRSWISSMNGKGGGSLDRRESENLASQLSLSEK